MNGVLTSKSYFFLIIFAAFLATPFVVALLQQDDDAYAISIAEEEKSTDGNYEFEKDLEVKQDFAICNFQESDKFQQPISFSDSFLSSIYIDPVSPPPKFIF